LQHLHPLLLQLQPRHTRRVLQRRCRLQPILPLHACCSRQQLQQHGEAALPSELQQQAWLQWLLLLSHEGTSWLLLGRRGRLQLLLPCLCQMAC
jgi:hypothetical protein